MANDRILMYMTQVSNNSRLTKEVAETLSQKLTDSEMYDFKVWLGIVQQQSK